MKIEDKLNHMIRSLIDKIADNIEKECNDENVKNLTALFRVRKMVEQADTEEERA